MNFKTTVVLFVLLVASVAGVFFVKSRQAQQSLTNATDKTKAAPPPGVKKLVADELGDIRKIVVHRKGEEPWTFEKPAPKDGETTAKWSMTSPLNFLANSSDLNNLANKIKDIQYEISYKPGEAGVTAASAGLEPAEATISITDEAGKSVDIELGKPTSDQTTYVRKKGASEIIVGKTAFKNLIKSKAAEYRDNQLWIFKPDQATRIEITDRTNPAMPTNYVLVRADGKWAFESPTSARATAKVDEMVRTLSALRVTQWIGDQGDKLAGFGFTPPAWTVKATVTEEVPVTDPASAAQGNDNAEAVEPKKEKKEATYVVDISDRSPIGEDTKTYVRIGGETVVASIMKTTTDRLKPVMNEWREMRLTTASIAQASKIEIRNKEGTITLVKKDGAWFVEGDDARAEEAAVNELIKSITDLKAVSFTDGEQIDEAKFGLTNPQAEVRLTITGSDEPERIIIGGSTDLNTNLLSYVRRNDSASVGKVRVADLANLMRNPNAYRDRKILDLAAGKIERLDLSINNRFGEGKIDVGLAQTDGAWSMVAPVTAAVRDDVAKKLVDSLTVLKALAVVDHKGNASAFGLDQPQAVVKIAFKPPVEYRVEPSKDESGAEKNVSVEVQPPTQTIELKMTQHDGKHYGQRSDRPAVYELTPEFFELPFSEFRKNEVLTFDDTKVTEFSIRDGATSHAFEKKDGKWKYKPEPDLPLDTKKVQNLLLQLKDLRTERYVAQAEPNLAKFGLDNPTKEVVVVVEKDLPRRLIVSSRTLEKDAAKGTYAAVVGQEGIFLLTTETLQRFEVNISSLE